MDYRDWAVLTMDQMAAEKRGRSVSIEFKEAQTVYLPQQMLPVNVADLKSVEQVSVPLISNSL